MKPRKTPPTRGLVAVVWHALLCILFSLGECLHAGEDAQKFGLDRRRVIGTSVSPYDMTFSRHLVSLDKTGKLTAIANGEMPVKLFRFGSDNILEGINPLHLPANQSEKTISRIVELTPSVADQRELMTEDESDHSGEQAPNKEDGRIADSILKVFIHGAVCFVIGFLLGSLPGSASARRRIFLHNVKHIHR
jgi:hypothetical protein